MRARPLCLLLTAMLTATAAGCVDRTLSITSDPPGALVHLNDREVGYTPVRVPFDFYGVYDVRLRRVGYQPLWTTAHARAPWWETPPIDLVADVTTDADVVIDWHFELEPVEPAGDARTGRLIERAEALGDRLDEPTDTRGR